MKKSIVVASITALAGSLLYVSAQSGPAYKPKRINRAIELLESGQPIYYTGGGGGFDEGVKLANTWADYINYEMEHGAFDITRLRDFMRGLVKGGPTRSGHRTPAVIVTMPVGGIDPAVMYANYWMVDQILSSGVHGILLCHARDPEAVKTFVRSSRYPTAKNAVGPGKLGEGLRGSGSQGFASQIWGISATEYQAKAGTWPLDPDGEILLGLKIEDKYALANSEKVASVPGIAFAEWGPGDMGMSLGLPDGHRPPLHPEMAKARARVLAACKANKLAFLNTVTPEDVEAMIAEGVRIGSGGQAAAEKGRKHTKRAMPW